MSPNAAPYCHPTTCTKHGSLLVVWKHFYCFCIICSWLPFAPVLCGMQAPRVADTLLPSTATPFDLPHTVLLSDMTLTMLPGPAISISCD